MRDHEINSLDNFIMAWVPEEGDDLSIVDRLINFHINDNKKKHGTTYSNGKSEIDLKVKNSIDSSLGNADFDLQKDYYEGYLQQFIDRYREKYNFIDTAGRWKVCEHGNVQWYPVTDGGFHRWHCERSNGHPIISRRLLVYMTYLNDVPEGGETEFYYQKLKIKPVRGMTVLWGSGWEYTHRGLPSPHEKMIATGWISYVEENDA